MKEDKSPGCGCSLLLSLLGLYLIYSIVENPETTLAICLILIILVLPIAILGIRRSSRIEKEKQEKERQAAEKLQQYKEELVEGLLPDIKNLFEAFDKVHPRPESAVTLCPNNFFYSYGWVGEGELCFRSELEDITERLERRSLEELKALNKEKSPLAALCSMSIPLSQIRYYRVEGDMYTETQISGGGGGGSSLTGTVVGGVLGGDTGAIIGSRKKVAPISSETVVHDSRKVALYYYPSPDADAMETLKFNFRFYSTLVSILPEKEYDYVVGKGAALQKEEKQESSETSGLKQKIQKLKELKEEGLLSEEEYSSKLQELLQLL